MGVRLKHQGGFLQACLAKPQTPEQQNLLRAKEYIEKVDGVGLLFMALQRFKLSALVQVSSLCVLSCNVLRGPSDSRRRSKAWARLGPWAPQADLQR